MSGIIQRIVRRRRASARSRLGPPLSTTPYLNGRTAEPASGSADALAPRNGSSTPVNLPLARWAPVGAETAPEPATDDVSPAPVGGDAVDEETVDGELVYDEPISDEPAYDEPISDEPAYDEPAYDEPIYDEPAYDEPIYDEPVVEGPVEEPVEDEPAVEEHTEALPLGYAAAEAPAHEATPYEATQHEATQHEAVPHEDVEPPRPSLRTRSSIRRRIRYLRALREVQFRDLGGFLVELDRFGLERPALVDEKLQGAAQVDGELRALQHALGSEEPLRELREAGLGGACGHCGAVYGSGDRFCAACGQPLHRGGATEVDPHEPSAGEPPPESGQPWP